MTYFCRSVHQRERLSISEIPTERSTWLTVSDGNHEQRLLELPLPSRTEEQGLQDLLV